MVNWKTYKIEVISKLTAIYWETALSFWLDDTVKYKDGYKNWIVITNHPDFTNWRVGDTVEVDLDKTESYGKLEILAEAIRDSSIIRRISSSNEIVSRNNNTLTSISQSQASGAIQMLNRAIDSDPRNKYTASMEVDPKTGNVFYHLSGERK